MICPNCGATISDGTTLCGRCGQSLPSGNYATKRKPGYISRLSKRGRTALFTVIGIIYALEVALFVFFVATHASPVPAVVFMLFTTAFIGLSLYRSNAVSRVNLNNPAEYYDEKFEQKFAGRKSNAKPGQNLFGETEISLEDGESIVDFAAPISNINPMGKANFVGPSNVGITQFTYNTMIVTNRRIIVMTSPLPGQGLYVGRSVDVMNDTFRAQQVREVAEGVVENLKKGGSQKPFPNDFWISRESIVKGKVVKIVGPYALAMAGYCRLHLQSGTKLVLNIRSKDDLARLKPFLTGNVQ